MNIKLSVPYYSQRDNISEPERSCNKSSCCMVAEYIIALRAGVLTNTEKPPRQLYEH
jgi:hypothetical protein